MASCELDTSAADKFPKKGPKLRICIKCKGTRPNLVVRNAVYCKACFQALVQQRFKRALNDSLAANDDTSSASKSLAIAWSGGLCSTVLLDLVSQLLGSNASRRSRRHQWHSIYVIHVTDLNEQSFSFERLFSLYPDFNFVSLSIEHAFHPNDGVPALPLISPLPYRGSLNHYLDGLPTETAKVSARRTITRLVLQAQAKSLGASHLLLGTSLSSFSTEAITRICQGGGYTLNDLTGSFEGLQLVYPLKEVGAKECAALLRWNALDIMLPIQPRATLPDIFNLTNAFISAIERDYPSTLTTIYRTTTKVVPRGDTKGYCSFCQREIMDGISLWHTRVAIQKSLALTTMEGLCFECRSHAVSKGRAR